LARAREFVCHGLIRRGYWRIVEGVRRSGEWKRDAGNARKKARRSHHDDECFFECRATMRCIPRLPDEPSHRRLNSRDPEPGLQSTRPVADGTTTSLHRSANAGLQQGRDSVVRREARRIPWRAAIDEQQRRQSKDTPLSLCFRLLFVFPKQSSSPPNDAAGIYEVVSMQKS
jgi:hypothetical protein